MDSAEQRKSLLGVIGNEKLIFFIFEFERMYSNRIPRALFESLYTSAKRADYLRYDKSYVDSNDLCDRFVKAAAHRHSSLLSYLIRMHTYHVFYYKIAKVLIICVKERLSLPFRHIIKSTFRGANVSDFLFWIRLADVSTHHWLVAQESVWRLVITMVRDDGWEVMDWMFKNPVLGDPTWRAISRR